MGGGGGGLGWGHIRALFEADHFTFEGGGVGKFDQCNNFSPINKLGRYFSQSKSGA